MDTVVRIKSQTAAHKCKTHSNFKKKDFVLLLWPTANSLLHLSGLQELEKLASRKLRISAKETMKIAEKLYTQG